MDVTKLKKWHPGLKEIVQCCPKMLTLLSRQFIILNKIGVTYLSYYFCFKKICKPTNKMPNIHSYIH